MSAIEDRRPRELANREAISMNHLITSAAAEKVTAWMTEESLEKRARRASRKKLVDGTIVADSQLVETSEVFFERLRVDLLEVLAQPTQPLADPPRGLPVQLP